MVGFFTSMLHEVVFNWFYQLAPSNHGVILKLDYSLDSTKDKTEVTICTLLVEN